jgi:oxygen-independent coproporphyrinogen-3 oxidase
MKALEVQLEFELKRFATKKESIESVFIGGGTPSTISASMYKPLFKVIKPYLKKDIEITSEANPNSATKEWLDGMFELGVNRISFGVQSFNKDKLKLLNRAHSSEDAKRAIIDAKEVGFQNISLDLIYATLGDTKELLEQDLKTAFSLPINHLSAYALIIEESTPFASRPEMSKESLKLTKWFFKEIASFGFKQYEISNFGVYQSSHNLGYWDYKDYIGLGSGAVGKLDFERFYPQTILEDYISNPLDIRAESLTQEDKITEQLFLGFRSSLGVDAKILDKAQTKRAKILVDEKKLTLIDGKLYNLDFLLADEIVLFLYS